MLRLVMAALLLLLVAACQHPEQPDVPVQGVRIAVRIVDQSREAVPGATVRFREEGATTFGGFGRVITGGDGVVEQTFTIPSIGTRFDFEVTPPVDPEISDSVLTILDVAIPCRDTTVEIVLERTVAVACGVTIPDETLASSLCLNFARSDLVCTPAFIVDCPRPMTISAPPLTVIPGATLALRVNGRLQTSPATLANPGDACEICMQYGPTSNGTSGAQRVDVTAAAPGIAPYRLLTVDFSAESKCDSCQCPAPLTVIHPRTGFDTVCVGEVDEQAIDLGTLVNTNQVCDLVFTRERGPSNGAIRITSFNNGSNVLEPGQTIRDLELSVRATVTGDIVDTIVYRMQTRTDDGSIRDCGELTIALNLRAVAPPCPLTLGGTLIVPNDPTRSNPLNAEICASAQRTVCITNPSPFCDLDIASMRISGPDASQFSVSGGLFPTSVAPGATECFTIDFTPDRAYYLASGTPPRSTFTATLAITTHCGVETRPLVGQIPAPRVPPLRLFPVDCPVNPNTGITVRADGSIVTDQQAGPGALISVISIDAAGQTADLNINTAYTFLRGGLTDQTPLCDLRFDPATLAACRSTGAAGVQTVRPGEVYLFSYTYNGCDFCALLWVESVDAASPTRTCPQIQFRICSPLAF